MKQASLTVSRISSLVAEFNTSAAIASVKPFGSGHINDTFRVVSSDPHGADYLLQRINHHVFRDVAALMSNLQYVTAHLRAKLEVLAGADTEKEVLTLVQTRNDQLYFKDDNGEYWRMFLFLKNTRSYDLVETTQQAFEGGAAFGQFQFLLSDLDTGLIKDSIPNFHRIESRLDKLQSAIQAAPPKRLEQVLPEIEFIRQRAQKMGELSSLGRAGILPQRIIHNDTKFNNVLLGNDDKAQCVIDLDTVMPGYVAYDFGDSVRTIINSAAEDEADVSRVDLNIPLFEAYTQGYLLQAVKFLTEAEIQSLIKGVLLMPYAQAVRFLTDYLEGDHYYKVNFPGHNLQRTYAQLALVKKLEDDEHLLQQVILDTWGRIKGD